MNLTPKGVLNGLCPVYKPAGLTSSDVVQKIKRILVNQLQVRPRDLKVGHGGTLDRDAEGVLVIGIGSGCKQLTRFLHCNKVYVATGMFGVTTDTLDISGTVTDQKPFDHVSESNLIKILKSFKGQSLQVPPVYSAVKFNGVRVSDLARSGINTIDMKSKEKSITIHSIALSKRPSFPLFDFIVSCSSGTYIRSLIRDIAERLNTVACMKHLCRIKQGPYGMNSVLRPDEWTYVRIRDSLDRPVDHATDSYLLL